MYTIVLKQQSSDVCRLNCDEIRCSFKTRPLLLELVFFWKEEEYSFTLEKPRSFFENEMVKSFSIEINSFI
jgi:hypothetical protein